MICHQCRAGTHVPQHNRHQKHAQINSPASSPAPFLYPIDEPINRPCQKQENHDQEIQHILATNQPVNKFFRPSPYRQPVSNIPHKLVILPHATHVIKHGQNKQRPESRHHLIRSQTGHEQTNRRICTQQQVKPQHSRQHVRKIYILNRTYPKKYVKQQNTHHGQPEYHQCQVFTQHDFGITQRSRLQQLDRPATQIPANHVHREQGNIKIQGSLYIPEKLPENTSHSPRFVSHGLPNYNIFQHPGHNHPNLVSKHHQKQPSNW